MNIRKIKKEVKKLDDEIFKKEALKWLRKIKVWSNYNHKTYFGKWEETKNIKISDNFKDECKSSYINHRV